MKWWMVAVGVEICDHSVSFVRVETDDFAERERERVEKKDVVEPEYKLMNSFLISTWYTLSTKNCLLVEFSALVSLLL